MHCFFWDEIPPFLVNAAFGVSRDVPLVDGRYRAAIRENSDPLGLQQQSKRRIHFRRDDNALEHSTVSAPIFDIVLLDRFLWPYRLGVGSDGGLALCVCSLTSEGSGQDYERGKGTHDLLSRIRTMAQIALTVNKRPCFMQVKRNASLGSPNS